MSLQENNPGWMGIGLGWFTLLVISAGFGACYVPEPNTAGEDKTTRPDQESWGVTITLTDEGLQKAVVQSGHLEKYNEKKYILLDDSVEVDFFDAFETHTSNLTSMMAEIDEKSNFMVAIHNVKVISDSGVTLFTDTLSWNSQLELIYTDNPIMLTTEEGDTLYGVGFESDVSMDHWKILQPSGVTPRGQDDG